MDLFAGAISSPADEALDLDRVCRAGLSRSPSRVGGRSPSDSDPTAVEVEATDKDRREECCICGCAPLALRLLRICFSSYFGAADARVACALTFFRRPRVKVRVTWYIGANKE